MKKAALFLEGFCQTAAMASALTAFFLVCFEEDSIIRVAVAASGGVISTAFWYMLSRYLGRVIGRQAEKPGNTFVNEVLPD